MMDIWQETCTLRFGDVDRSDRLTIAKAFDFFQEVAISHAEVLGVGRDSLEKTGQVWLLSRISVQFDRRPRYGEKVTVRTWPRGSEKLFAIRDYDIRDEKDTPVVRGRSSWIIIDIEKRRPLRPQSVMDNLPLNEGLDALPGGGAALPAREGLVKTGERMPRYSDIDYNGHVNNTRYIQWIQDLMNMEDLEKADTIRLDINYMNEVKAGELVEMFVGAVNDGADAGGKGWAIEGRKAATGQPSFRAELRLR